MVWQALRSATEEAAITVSESLDFALTVRLREVLADEPATEAELRTLSERVIAWARSLEAQLRGSERRLEELTVDSASPLREIAAELHRLGALGPQLAEARSLLVGLEERARALRSEWVSRQAESSPSSRLRLTRDTGAYANRP